MAAETFKDFDDGVRQALARYDSFSDDVVVVMRTSFVHL